MVNSEKMHSVIQNSAFSMWHLFSYLCDCPTYVYVTKSVCVKDRKCECDNGYSLYYLWDWALWPQDGGWIQLFIQGYQTCFVRKFRYKKLPKRCFLSSNKDINSFIYHKSIIKAKTLIKLFFIHPSKKMGYIETLIFR